MTRFWRRHRNLREWLLGPVLFFFVIIPLFGGTFMAFITAVGFYLDSQTISGYEGKDMTPIYVQHPEALRASQFFVVVGIILALITVLIAYSADRWEKKNAPSFFDQFKKVKDGQYEYVFHLVREDKKKSK
jgi:ABC-type Fe3+ transport system permease subunit